MTWSVPRTSVEECSKRSLIVFLDAAGSLGNAATAAAFTGARSSLISPRFADGTRAISAAADGELTEPRGDPEEVSLDANQARYLGRSEHPIAGDAGKPSTGTQ